MRCMAQSDRRQLTQLCKASLLACTEKCVPPNAQTIALLDHLRAFEDSLANMRTFTSCHVLRCGLEQIYPSGFETHPLNPIILAFRLE